MAFLCTSAAVWPRAWAQWRWPGVPGRRRFSPPGPTAPAPPAPGPWPWPTPAAWRPRTRPVHPPARSGRLVGLHRHHTAQPAQGQFHFLFHHLCAGRVQRELRAAHRQGQSIRIAHLGQGGAHGRVEVDVGRALADDVAGIGAGFHVHADVGAAAGREALQPQHAAAGRDHRAASATALATLLAGVKKREPTSRCTALSNCAASCGLCSRPSKKCGCATSPGAEVARRSCGMALLTRSTEEGSA